MANCWLWQGLQIQQRRSSLCMQKWWFFGQATDQPSLWRRLWALGVDRLWHLGCCYSFVPLLKFAAHIFFISPILSDRCMRRYYSRGYMNAIQIPSWSQLTFFTQIFNAETQRSELLRVPFKIEFQTQSSTSPLCSIGALIEYMYDCIYTNQLKLKHYGERTA